jgi:hypothetical protein
MRFCRKKNHKSWTPYTSRLAHEAKARKRLESPRDEEPRRFPAGNLLGVLRWHALDGSVTQCVIRQGRRANGIRIGKTECGWDNLLRRMRAKLSAKKFTYA